MSQEDKRDAAEHAARAAKQMKHAAKNVVEAADASKDHVADEVVEGTHKVAEAGQKLVHRLRPQVLSASAVEIGIGFFALAIAGYAGAAAYNRFHNAVEIGKHLTENSAKAAHHIQHSE